MIYQIRPVIGDKAKRKLIEYIKKDNWITEHKVTSDFEKSFAKFTNSKHCIVFLRDLNIIIPQLLGQQKNLQVYLEHFLIFLH